MRSPAPDPRLLATLLIRLCVVVVVAFGSRPCGVLTHEGPRAPLVVGLRAQGPSADEAQPRVPSVPSFGLRTSGVPVLRGPTNGGSAPAAATLAEALAPVALIAALENAGAAVSRRTPCAACGDGTPYDATAPPFSA